MYYLLESYKQREQRVERQKTKAKAQTVTMYDSLESYKQRDKGVETCQE